MISCKIFLYIYSNKIISKYSYLVSMTLDYETGLSIQLKILSDK